MLECCLIPPAVMSWLHSGSVADLDFRVPVSQCFPLPQCIDPESRGPGEGGRWGERSVPAGSQVSISGCLLKQIVFDWNSQTFDSSFIHSLIYLFVHFAHKYFLGICYVPDTSAHTSEWDRWEPGHHWDKCQSAPTETQVSAAVAPVLGTGCDSDLSNCKLQSLWYKGSSAGE